MLKNILQLLFPQSLVLGRIKDFDGILLTFDDGPHPKHTPIILRELAKRNVKAVFFVSGVELERYPELGKSIVEQGHLLGNHTYEHLNARCSRFKKYRESIEKAEAYISPSYLDMHYTRLFRPPYSSFSITLIFYILFTKYILVNWTIDSRDSFILSANKLVSYVSTLKIQNGDVLLFHEDYPQTVEALPEILDYLINQEYQIILPSF